MDDTTLTTGLRCGDRSASKYVMDHYTPALYRYAYDHLQDAILTEDLVAEVLARMVARLDQFRPERGTFQAWLFRIAHNLIIDHYRAAKRRPQISLEQWRAAAQHPEPGALDSRIVMHETRDELQAGLAQLTAEQREVILLHLVADLDLPAVATSTGRTVTSVRSLYYRGLESLRRVLRRSDQRYNVLGEPDGRIRTEPSR